MRCVCEYVDDVRPLSMYVMLEDVNQLTTNTLQTIRLVNSHDCELSDLMFGVIVTTYETY